MQGDYLNVNRMLSAPGFKHNTKETTITQQWCLESVNIHFRLESVKLHNIFLHHWLYYTFKGANTKTWFLLHNCI